MAGAGAWPRTPRPGRLLAECDRGQPAHLVRAAHTRATRLLPRLRSGGGGWRTDALQDARHALRLLARDPGFAAVTVSTLALGIGANAAVFSVLHSVLLEPLPYEEPHELVRMYWATETGEAPGYMPNPAFIDFRDNLSSVDVAAVNNYRDRGTDLVVGDRVERVRALPVSSNYFDVLGADMLRGRTFTVEEEREDLRVAVVSERLWRRALGADPSAVGRTLVLDGRSHVVLGVAPSALQDPFEGAIDIWLPQAFDLAPWQWDNDYLTVFGRLAPGTSLERARAEVALRIRTLLETFDNPAADVRAPMLPLREELLGTSRPMLLVLAGAVALLLINACVNVTTLVLARGSARARELAIRTALGSGRGRLARQLLAESFVLAVVAGCAGLAAGALVQRGLAELALTALPEVTRLGYGWPVALFGGGLALVVGAAVGALPALRLTRRGAEAAVGREARGAPRRERLRRTLVVAQVTIALVLLVGAGLLLESLRRLGSVDPGVDASDVWTFQTNLPSARYGDPAERVRFHSALHERLSALPGVRAVGAGSRLPATGPYHPWSVRADRDGAPAVDGSQNRVVQGDWFAALDIELLEGRLFGPEDGPEAPRRVVVSRSLARQAYPGESAVGRRIRVLGEWLDVIGVVEDVRLTPRGEPAPTVYHAHEQFAGDRNWPLFQVMEADPRVPELIEQARVELAAIDPLLVAAGASTLAEVLGRDSARERLVTILLAAFAALAVALASLGIYGILAYDVGRSRREIGVRIALGAEAGDVRGMVMRRGLVLTVGGVVAGTIAAWALSRLLASLLYGVSPTQPRIYAVVAASVLLLGALASWLPARRATAVEPAEAFRSG